MSHTGNVIRPQKSPGLIEIITTGHGVFVIEGKITLVYSRPHEYWPSRLVPFHGLKHIQIHTGNYVRFSLVEIEETPNDLIPLEEKIRNKIPGFSFKYVAEEVDLIQDQGRPHAIRPTYTIFTAQEQDVEGKVLVDFDFIGGLDRGSELNPGSKIEVDQKTYDIEDVMIVDRHKFEELSNSCETKFLTIDRKEILRNEQIPQWVIY